MEAYTTHDVEIPINGKELTLKGTIYTAAKPSMPNQWMIIFPGLLEHRKSYLTTFFSNQFASTGVHILSYDYRAHGETAAQTGKNWLKLLPSIFSDAHQVIEWLLDTYLYDKNENDYNLSLFGRSLGGAIILTQGYIEKRAQKLIALCTRYDYHSVSKIKFPEKVIKHISPIYYLKEIPKNKERILLAHCKDDSQIPFENLLLIKNHLNLPEENVLIFKKGGHSFKGHREEIFKKTLEFLKF
ncbi:MAG: Alpha/beta hydrolase family protein [Promethearchaeota archaeon]|nr:MAG: Alpha/beta hydrolase family protein [Candidatus Lokiarchaeota archaeon]